MGRNHNLLRKTRNTFRDIGGFLRKGAAVTGSILQKGGDIGNRLLDGVAMVDPALAVNPLYIGAKAALTGAQVVGRAAESLSRAQTIPDAAGSIRQAYDVIKPALMPPPGAESVQTALS